MEITEIGAEDAAETAPTAIPAVHLSRAFRPVFQQEETAAITTDFVPVITAVIRMAAETAQRQPV